MKSIDHNFDVSKEFGLEDLPNEIWKDVPDYEGLYQVSNLGRVKSLERLVKNNLAGLILQKERILRPYFDSNGYKNICFCVESKKKHILIHRLVAFAFIPNPENKREIDHINGIKTDNRVFNLRWATSSENKLNPITHEKISGVNSWLYGKKISAEVRAKMSANSSRKRKIINLTTGDIFFSAKSASLFYGLSSCSILNSMKKHCKSAGFYWGYYSE